MTYHSPYTGNALEQFAGAADVIAATAEQYKALGDAMKTTADTLRDITESQISMGTDRLKEDAEKLEGDLRQAGVRYSGTGNALAPYATALDTAQEWYRRNNAAVSAAERSYLEADSTFTSLLTAPSYGQEAGDDRAEEMGDAQRALEGAEDERRDQWQAFDSVYSVWEDAFDTAADGIAEAMDAADNDDGKWDWLTDALKILGYVIIVLAIAALFVVSSPWSSILLAATLALSAVHLAGTIYLYANGKASLSDVLWSTFGLVTAGIGGLAARSIRLATAANGGAGLLQASQTASRLPVFASGVRTFSMPGLLSTGRLNPFSVMARGSEWAALSQWGPRLAQWTASSGPRGGTIASAWADVVVSATPNISGAGITAVGSWAAGIAGGVYSSSPLYQPFGRP